MSLLKKFNSSEYWQSVDVNQVTPEYNYHYKIIDYKGVERIFKYEDTDFTGKMIYTLSTDLQCLNPKPLYTIDNIKEIIIRLFEEDKEIDILKTTDLINGNWI